MGEVKHVVSNLVEMLDKGQKEAGSLIDPMHRLQSYLEEKPKSIIQESLDRLLGTIRAEVAKIGNRRSAVVLVSPEERVSVEESYSDFWLERLKSQGFFILTLEQFRSFIQSLNSQVAERNLIPVIEFLRANAKFEWHPVYSPAAIGESEQGKPSAPSRWNPSDFLPALPPHLPLPRGLFKD